MESLLLLYFLIINLIAFFTMKKDKEKAIKQQYRISEQTLWLLAVLGGAIGATAAMFRFRHKTKHISFRIGFPLMMLIELALAAILLS
ncbi:DUF1294 domain-containing protein [Peribacillus glennii]|uniref:DUF1294 domain-containing protein n=1 Tax=Peribacillus glennii TaxID=2303991 RepID=A0A372LI40_9BACI|nr:DUF1294 domain-containing protein [Peribacillus glennii]RFU65953.1 DUF1294 domain-containing protein [Peribacillus glennii]